MASIDRLLEIMARLRDPDGGCPWDVEQSFATIAPYTIEEAYEVAHAIERGDLEDLRDELGDLLLQVVYHAQMASEQDSFAFDDVVEAICEKLVRRHPHVFGDAEAGGGAERMWEKLKAAERAEKQARALARGDADDPLADIPRAQPALMRARKLASRARHEAGSVPLEPADAVADAAVAAFLARGTEEAADAAGDDSRVLGTLLQACARAAQARGLDPEELLRERNLALERRVRAAIVTSRG